MSHCHCFFLQTQFLIRNDFQYSEPSSPFSNVHCWSNAPRLGWTNNRWATTLVTINFCNLVSLLKIARILLSIFAIAAPLQHFAFLYLITLNQHLMSTSCFIFKLKVPQIVPNSTFVKNIIILLSSPHSIQKLFLFLTCNSSLSDTAAVISYQHLILWFQIVKMAKLTFCT